VNGQDRVIMRMLIRDMAAGSASMTTFSVSIRPEIIEALKTAEEKGKT